MVAPAFSQGADTPTVGGELGGWGPCAKGVALGSLVGSCLACALAPRLWAGQQRPAAVRALSSDCPEILHNPAAPLSDLLRCEAEAARAQSRARQSFLRRTKEGQEAAHVAEVDAAQSAISDLQGNPHVYSMVGSWNDWRTPEPMDKDTGVQPVSSGVNGGAASVNASASLWQLPITIQAPSGGAGGKERTEEFQILVDGDGWENVRWRLFPNSEDNASWLLHPGGAASGAGVASAVGEGAHGRNWKVQGSPGDSFLVTYDSASREVSLGVATTTTRAGTRQSTTVTLAKEASDALGTRAPAKDDRWVGFEFGGDEQTTAACHDTLEGEACWVNVMWAKTDGIDRHPEWYPGLNAGSSLAEFQATLHAHGLGDCAAPCQSEERKLPAPFLVEN